MKHSNTTKLLFLCSLVLALSGVHQVIGYRIYALSNTLDYRQGGTWNTVPLHFGNQEGEYFVDFLGAQLGFDKTNNLFVTALNGVPGQRPFVTTNKWDTATNERIGASFYIGRWAFDQDNYFYSVNRYNPAPSPPYRNVIVRIASDDYNDDFNTSRVIGWARETADITSFRNGAAMVMVGNFTSIYKGSTGNAKLVSANRVALWTVKTKTWETLGSGIPSAPSRIVSSSDGTQLVALVGDNILYRWNATANKWSKHVLALTDKKGAATGRVIDLAFGGNRLFLLGDFFKVNGVGSRNVSALTFQKNGAIGVIGVGVGLPGGEPQALFARSSTNIFVGGSTNGKKVVYEWRSNRPVPWDRVGDLGFTLGHSPVVALTVLETPLKK